MTRLLGGSTWAAATAISLFAGVGCGNPQTQGAGGGGAAATAGSGGGTGAGGGSGGTAGQGGQGGQGGSTGCGDGSLALDEECDGAAMPAWDCAVYGYVSGQLACKADCTFDTSGCELQTPVNGSPCSTVADCAGDLCFTHPGGYCSQYCASDSHCFAGGICEDKLCLVPCTSAGDCRSGYVCGYPLGGTGRTACIPPCSGNQDCLSVYSSVCDVSTASCRPCDVTADCAHIWWAPYCSANECVECVVQSDCLGGQVCSANACRGTRVTGDPCTQNAQCVGGAACLVEGLGYLGGYCSAYCLDDSNCAAAGGGLCVQIRCWAECSTDAECRSGYICDDGFVGSTGARSVCVVPCLGDPMCTFAQMSRCDLATGRCEPCLIDGDCSHIGLTTACVSGVCQ